MFNRLITFIRIYKMKLFILLLIFGLCILFSYRKKVSKSKINAAMDDRQYAILIDCGSSGSRLYIYFWSEMNNANEIPVIHHLKDDSNDVISFKVTPGLSTFANNPEKAGPYMLELISKANNFIPFNKRKNSKLYILATAGMRLIDESSKSAIISSLKMLQSQIDFIIEKIEVISGTMEGFFSWISLNYILKNFQLYCGATNGVIEVGGGSMQLAFETNSKSNDLSQFSYKCSVNGNIITHYVYSVTFLGLGVNSAVNYYHKNLNNSDIDKKSDACMLSECRNEAVMNSKIGTGDIDICHSSIVSIFGKFFDQTSVSRLFQNFQNQLHRNLDMKTMSFYGLSEFWYGFNDFLHYNGPILPNLYWSRSKEFCSTKCWILENNLMRGLYKSTSRHLLRLQCFKSAFLTFIMSKFLPDSISTPVINIHSHNEEEIEWTYGAIVYYSSQNK